MDGDASDAVGAARAYYDSADAEAFYSQIWGGTDIHIGLYGDSDDVAAASARTVEWLASLIDADAARVVDLGSGYAGSARFLARTRGFDVTCINISEIQNERARAAIAAEGLEAQVHVFEGDFHDTGLGADFDVVWSQDAFVHSPTRDRLIDEAFRLLRPGGTLVFTDILASPGAAPDRMKPILDRIQLASMGSVEGYMAMAEGSGFVDGEFFDRSQQLVRHYAAVAKMMDARRDSLDCSPEYMDRMLAGLDLWIEAGRRGDLQWGAFRFHRPQ